MQDAAADHLTSSEIRSAGSRQSPRNFKEGHCRSEFLNHTMIITKVSGCPSVSHTEAVYADVDPDDAHVVQLKKHGAEHTV